MYETSQVYETVRHDRDVRHVALGVVEEIIRALDRGLDVSVLRETSRAMVDNLAVEIRSKEGMRALAGSLFTAKLDGSKAVGEVINLIASVDAGAVAPGKRRDTLHALGRLYALFRLAEEDKENDSAEKASA